MSRQIANRIVLLRELMSEADISALIVPQADPHQSEYLAEHWQARRFLSGFSGSAGTLVVTADRALLWTDSRYFIQASQQLEGTGIQLMKDGMPGVDTMTQWLIVNIPVGRKVAIDGWLISAQEGRKLQRELNSAGIILVTDFNPIDRLWPDRPALPDGKIFIHEVKYAGETAASKLSRLRERLTDVSATFISALDEIAWMLNIRGRDVRCNPVASSFLYVSTDKAILFIDSDKLTPETDSYLLENNIETRNYSGIEDFLKSPEVAGSVLIDFAKTAYRVIVVLGEKVVKGENPISMFKAIKNSTQIAGFRNAMRRDGAALAEAFMEIERRINDGTATTETDVADIIHRRRANKELFFDESFETIAGYGPHGAIVHYTADENTAATLESHGLLLVDTGAQYLDGTTDITRTIALGTPTPQEKRDFTLVLKGHIALARAVFPEGTRGVQLDILAKQFLWRDGLQFMHGTGHGVGHFLNVHEGPQTIRNNNNDTPMLPGMVTSDEPGLYREGIHGIRCENLILTIETDIKSPEGFRFFAFETLTLFPFDTTLIDNEIFTNDERLWLNAYHQQVFAELSPLLDAPTKAWLESKTNAI